jgi:hypothetical protein
MQNVKSAFSRAAIAPVAILVFAAGCSGGGSQKGLSHTIQSVATATRAAGAGSAHGTVRGTGAASAPLESSWVEPSVANAQDNGRATFGMFFGAKSPGTVELRWIGNALFIGRVVRPSSVGRLVGFQSLLVRAPGDREFIPTSMTYIAAVPGAFSPARLAAWMSGVSTQVKSRPGDAVGGTPTTEYYLTKPLPVLGPWTNVSVSVWADSHDRVLKAHLSSSGGGADYTVDGYTSQAQVSPPPQSQTVTPTTLPPPHATGAYAVAASGKTGAVSWSVMRAPGTRDTECWKWVATPAAKILNATADGSRCYLAQQPGDSQADATAFVVRTAPGGAYSALAVRLPDAPTKATLGFAGGRMLPLQPTGKTLVWVGPSSPLPAYLGLTFTNGKKIQCFAGTLIDVEDLKTTSDSQVADGEWSCF